MVCVHQGHFCDSATRLLSVQFTWNQGTKTKGPRQGLSPGQRDDRRNSENDNMFFYWAMKRRPVVSEEKTSGIKAAPCDQRAGALEKIFMLQTPPG